MVSVKNKIFCLGGAGIDYKFTAIEDIHPGTSNPVISCSSLGGVARNVAENLSRWTNEVYLQTAIGGDPAGHEILNAACAAGVNVERCLILEQHRTAHYYAVIGKDGGLQVAYADMAIFDNIPVDSFIHHQEPWPRHSLVFLDTNLPEAVLAAALDEGRKQQCRIVIDPVSVHKARKLPRNLENVFMIKPNQAEAACLSGMEIKNRRDCRQAGYLLLDRGIDNIIISLGADGYMVLNRSHCKHVPARRVEEIRDENGAGDAFCAGILYGLQQNYSIMQACEMGEAAAVLTIQSLKTVNHAISAACLENGLLNKINACA